MQDLPLFPESISNFLSIAEIKIINKNINK